MKASSLWRYEDDINNTTRWWNTYAVGKYGLSRPRDAHEGFVKDVFGAPTRLARSASTTSLTYYKEAPVERSPLRRCPTYSCLSPSHQMYASDRYVPRHLGFERAYQPHSSTWLDRAYLPRKFVESLSFRSKPEHIPSFLGGWNTPVPKESYLAGERKHMNRYCSLRLTCSSDRIGQYTYTAHDENVKRHRWSRHLHDGGTFFNKSLGLPAFRESQHPYRMFRLREKVRY